MSAGARVRVRAPLAGVTGLLGAVAVALTLAAPAVRADSFNPIRMTLHITSVARRGVSLPTTVDVSADPGVLDGSEGPLRMEVKLASECGGTFQTTPGVTLLDAPLHPGPQTGRAYRGSVSGSGRPTAYGVQTVCMFLEDTQVGRVYANDESHQVNVSPACTTTAARYDATQRSVARDRRRLRHTPRSHQARRRQLRRRLARSRHTAARQRRSARAACGSGVTL